MEKLTLEELKAILKDAYVAGELQEMSFEQYFDSLELTKPVAITNEKFWPESSQVARTKFYPESQTLEVEFKGFKGKENSVYQYFDFPQEAWNNLFVCESIGTYINQVVKKGGYTYKNMATGAETAPANKIGNDNSATSGM